MKFDIDYSLPLPAALMLRTVANGKDTESTLVIGVIPTKILKDKDDLFLKGSILLLPDDTWKNKYYYGWSAEDVITNSNGEWAKKK